ncbi:carbon starvation CstA family protein [Mesoterricola silvestris]|uniref:Carbon starvation protein A n=1 Tax=Mesoterricola silvestris TaxID=2927979 RepID=A0AA48GPS3_9BACT|nr:carbon starvation protein A [Mesoterricola silvestris]BDU73465.1 carbon starvation protein A [Mesoterricola silvestris]
MNALTLVFVTLCIFALAYRYYGIFLATKVLNVDAERVPPAIAMADGHDYHKTNKFVLFGHHFAAIAAAGPLLGPVLAAQFGWLPGTLWIIIGCVLGGAVHDMVVLFASVRYKGKSLAHIAENEIGRRAGTVAGFAILFILILTLAGLSIGVVNALFNSPWGTFTVLMTMPIALYMGIHMYILRKGDVIGASVIGVVALFFTLLAGPYVAASPTLSHWLTLTKNQLGIIIPAYGFIASALPVWLLLCPRDYLSTYLKLGVIIMLVGGIAWVHPNLVNAPVTQYIHGGGPIIPGTVYPFIFITIACGALSGFHAIIGTGTTPKMIASEKDILFVGYGAMLVEGVVAIMALIAASVLMPSDYFAINALPKAYAALHMTPVHLPALGAAVGEQLQGRPGGAVSLAVGMSYIFSSIPWMKHLAAYWYHFAIMFEAVFILTAVDTGTRVGRYMLQEMLGKVWPRFDEKKWMPGIIVTSLLFTAAWGYLVYTGDISTIWPLFGMANQLLATCALIVGTTMLIRHGKAKYAWTTAVPGLFMVPVTFMAGIQNILYNYLPKGLWLLVTFSVVLMILMAIVFVEAFVRWFQLLKVRDYVKDRHGVLVLAETEE